MGPVPFSSYTDTFAHAFDTKGRITVPSEWREEPYEKHLFVFPSSLPCVRIYPASFLVRLQQKMAELKDSDPQRRQMQELASLGQSAMWDQQGRIMVKERLRTGAGLTRDAMLVGRMDYFQIWDKAAWERQPSTPTTVEEALGALGL